MSPSEIIITQFNAQSITVLANSFYQSTGFVLIYAILDAKLVQVLAVWLLMDQASVSYRPECPRRAPVD